MKKFFITTPIYYSSGKAHIGHAYTTILADVIAKYKKQCGYDVFFLTGLDEHGQKILNKANELKLKPKQMLDANARSFLNLWKKLDITYSFFIRTTDLYHVQAVKKIFTFLWKKKLIYKGKWEGFYCVNCEENYSKARIIKKNGKNYCQIGHELVYKNEETYFLIISKFQNWIYNFLIKNKNFIYPSSRIKELINNFLITKLEDLSITRTTFDWGIKVEQDKKHVIYVWIDALFNYLTALGYLSKNNKNYLKYWVDKKTEIVHLISKEITRFHGIYWPILLHRLNLRLPNKIISHDWIITNEGKMSKSKGNIIDPLFYINEYGSDALRYFLIKEFSIENDGLFSHELFLKIYNHDLVNNYGNMTTRISGMLKMYFKNIIPELTTKKLTKNDKMQLTLKKKLLNIYQTLINNYKVNALLIFIQACYNSLNKYIENTKPWLLFKTNKKEQLANFLNILFNFNLVLQTLLKPVLPKTTKKIWVHIWFWIKF